MIQLEQLLAPPRFESSVQSPYRSLDNALGRIFTSTQEETRLQKARRIMGVTVVALADEDLESYITEFQYLIDEWFDSFERQIFDGVTLKQLLGQA